MEQNIIVRMVEEKNSFIFQATLQNIIDEFQEKYNLEVQYQTTNKLNFDKVSYDPMYTALIIARRK